MSQAFKWKLEEFTGKNYDAGVLLEDLPIVEECFNLGINVYDLDEKKMAKVVRLTGKAFENSCHLNLFENHFSYISKFKSYGKKFQCGDCKRFISRSTDLTRHKTTCKADEVQEKFVGGKYILSKFELCEELNINIPEEDRYDPYFTTYDFEAFTVLLWRIFLVFFVGEKDMGFFLWIANRKITKLRKQILGQIRIDQNDIVQAFTNKTNRTIK